MANISSFPNGFINGVTVRGMPVNVMYPGRVFFLNNSNVTALNGVAGSDLNPGTYQKPFATLAGALARTDVVAGRGDIICAMAGHAETIATATALALNKKGVCVIGLGNGDLRPTFTLSAAAATIGVSAADVAFVNCVFVANFANIASLFTLTNAPYFTLSYCEVRDNSAILNFVNLVTTDATSNHANGLNLDHVNWYGLGAQTNTTALNIAGTNDRITVNECYITHAAVTGGGLAQIASGKAVTNLLVSYNRLNFVGATSLTTAIVIIAGGTANSGAMYNNSIKGLDDTTPILVTAASGLTFFGNSYQANADKSGFLLPALDS